jgi:hypothetical protein
MKWAERMSASSGLAEVIWPLVIVGVAMIAAGAAAPGTHGQAVVLLIVFGSGLVVAGALATRYKQLEIGLQGIKVSRDDGQAMPMPWLVAEAETLSGVAQLVLGDVELARKVVEDVLAKVSPYRRQVPLGQHDVTTFKMLVEGLRRAEKKSWFNGGRAIDRSDRAGAALDRLGFSRRVTVALDMELPAKEVAEILDRSEADVSLEVEEARKALSPHLESNGGDHV